MATHFDPDAAALPGSGIFGLPHSRDEAHVVLVPVPFDATTSYGGGASSGPAAVRDASLQVDLHDGQFGPVYQRGIFMEEPDSTIRELSERARQLALPIIDRGGADPASPDDSAAVKRVDDAGAAVNDFTYEAFSRILAEGKRPGLVGGDHATPFGAIRACAEHIARVAPAQRSRSPHDDPGGMGILHVDAHMDFREAFEGFAWSHASIMHNVMERIPGVTRLVQVGLRDVGQRELGYARERAGRIFPHFDLDWARAMLDGERFSDLCRSAIDRLPRHVYISFDIDGLDPSLCPHTGTPVPGGLGFNQVCILLQTLKESGREVVGFDLVEVCPGPNPEEPEWDGNVGARVLYKLCGVVA